MSISNNTPIIVGVGQFTERLTSPEYRALSASDIAAAASQRAFADALSLKQLAGSVDAIATTRTFEDSSPNLAQPFGKSNNFPRSIAKRLGLNPTMAVWEKAGGNSSQHLISEFFDKVASGSVQMALITGAENISSARHLKAEGKSADWSETVEGEVEDRGMGMKGMMTRNNMTHRLFGAPPAYGLAENARRGRLGMSRAAYALEMGRLFAPFSRVASANPYSSAETKAYTAEEIVTVSERNRMIADPYPQRMVARDQVNMGAAVLITTVGKARELGIPESKWVYLHGYCDLAEREIMQRRDIGASPAAQMSARSALAAAGIGADDVSFFDFYSCFPIAVSNVACDGLGLSPDDKRGLTVTGGLPYFGGPGNNYSMHGVVGIVEKLRAAPGSYGFVGANGGFLSKYSTGVYSTTAAPWKACDSSQLQATIDGWESPAISYEPEGAATIETYSTVYVKGQPAYAIVVGRLDATGERFLANSEDGDEQTLQQMLASDPLGRQIHVQPRRTGNRFAFSAARLTELFPARAPGFRESYEYCLVERRGHLLEVTINRPDVRNCLHPMANDELAEIFDAYEADGDLWVAILTGAGTVAFSAGNDLKYSASGKPMWSPKTGFGGLTNRVRVKPVIAAVNGFAMGGGTEISLACDIVVADEKAQFALSEVRVGLFAGAGGLVRLPRQIAKKVAVELILTGRKLPAAEAYRLGLISRVVPDGKSLEAAREIAAEILEASPTSVRLSMQVMNDADAYPAEIEAIRNMKAGVADELITSEDFQEGPKAFAQKRKPVWKNR